MKKLRVFLVDDHPVVRAGLKMMVGGHAEMEVVGEAADGITAYERVVALSPDVVVMDVSLPGLNGHQLTERLNRDRPTVKVLTLTVHEDSGHIHQLLNAGARGYVLKRTVGDELVKAIQVVSEGGVYIDPAIATKIVSKVGRPRKSEGCHGLENELSDREKQVVREMASGFGNKEIAIRLDLSVKTVETYRARALEKLGLRSRAELVQYVRMCGWLAEV
jgi:DNA-binding NarL/FixJ family response regulator